MHLMKLIPLLAGCSLLSLSSCALFSKKDKKDETIGDESIPPPSNQQASLSEAKPQEELPELPAASEQVTSPNEKLNVKEIDGFRFKDILTDLPSQRDLASPPASLAPSVPKTEGTQSNEDETKPLVSNP